MFPLEHQLGVQRDGGPLVYDPQLAYTETNNSVF